MRSSLITLSLRNAALNSSKRLSYASSITISSPYRSKSSAAPSVASIASSSSENESLVLKSQSDNFVQGQGQSRGVSVEKVGGHEALKNKVEATTTLEEDKEVGSENQGKSIRDYPIQPRLVASLSRAGINEFFPVQEKTIEKAIQGQDLIVRSKTGSGKTLAFAIPIIETIYREQSKQRNRRSNEPLAIVLAPTRELALQVQSELTKYAPDISSACIYGGTSYSQQVRALARGVDVVVGTPGRVKDLIDGRNLSLEKVKISVLDEADEMLRVGFREQLDEIFELMPPVSERQNMMFSATFSQEIKEIAREYMRDHEVIDLIGKKSHSIPQDIEMVSMVVKPNVKHTALALILGRYCSGEDGTRALVFATTKLQCDEVAGSAPVRDSGVVAAALHGDMSQQSREVALNAFRTGRVRCIIATDVAARGLDIPEVDLVIHYGPPDHIERFVHRTGRTGRAGRKGTVIVLHDVNEVKGLKEIEHKLDIKFVPKSIPDTAQTLEIKHDDIVKRLDSTDVMAINHFRSLAEKLRQMQSSGEMKVDPLAAALSVMTGYNKHLAISALSGTLDFQSIIVKNEKDVRHGVIQFPRARYSQQQGDSSVYNEMRSQITGVLSEKFDVNEKHVKDFELGANMDFAVIDVSPTLASRLLRSSGNGLVFEKLENEVPPLANLRPYCRRSFDNSYFANQNSRRFGRRSDRQGRPFRDRRDFDNDQGWNHHGREGNWRRRRFDDDFRRGSNRKFRQRD